MFETVSADALGYVAAALVFLTFLMKTMVTLRIIAIASNIAFILYAASAGLAPILVLHGLLLPLNLARLWQLHAFVRAARAAEEHTGGEESFDWLVPIGRRRRFSAGETIFRKGDRGRSMYILTKGRIRLPEIGVTLEKGALLGEISLFSGDGIRTLSAEADGPVEVAELTDRRVRELYFDNPRFAYSLIRIITARLLRNSRVLEDAAPEMRNGPLAPPDADTIAPRAAGKHRAG
ncbi:Crp/Fnr family transcriptional regulator [Palleronia sp. KMU-117]|uniref:Crp/Fnr family transcriptional regulator n=1 Tax=Palleronia sp. KMU-117 TaxID=3434108 RepID=UPI003D75D12B